MISDSQARMMYSELKRRLGERRALKVAGLPRLGIEEQDLYRCTLSNRAKIGIELMHEKYVEGFDRIKQAKDKYLTHPSS